MNETIYKKKFFIIFMIIFIFITLSSNMIFATTKELNQIADQFNSNNPMADHLKETYNSTVVASVENNKIVLTHNNSPFSDTKIQKLDFILENNILSTIITEKEDTTEYMSELSMTWMLIDCIGQIDGYEKKEVYETLKGTGDAYKEYSINNDGFEIKTTTNDTTIKLDLSKKFSLKKENISENNNIINNLTKNYTTTNHITNNITPSSLPQTGIVSNYIFLILGSILIIVIVTSYKKFKK